MEVMVTNYMTLNSLAVAQIRMERSMMGFTLLDHWSNELVRDQTWVKSVVQECVERKWHWCAWTARMPDCRWAKAGNPEGPSKKGGIQEVDEETTSFSALEPSLKQRRMAWNGGASYPMRLIRKSLNWIEKISSECKYPLPLFFSTLLSHREKLFHGVGSNSAVSFLPRTSAAPLHYRWHNQ